MSNLYAFLNPEVPENTEVVVSKRFKDKDGKIVPFVVRPVSQDDSAALMKKNTRKDKKSGVETIDRAAYTADLVATAVVLPDLNNAELQEHYGVLGASALLRRMLLVGEFATLSIKVQEISGIDVDPNEEIEEAKN